MAVMETIGARPEPIIHQCIHKGEDLLFKLKDNVFKLICNDCHDLFVGLNKDKIVSAWNFQTGEKIL